MTAPFLHGETVVLHRRSVTGRDADGNDVLGSTDEPVDGCAFAPAGSVEALQGKDVVTDQPSVYVPAGTVVAAVDAVTARGVRYEVDGTPEVYVNPFNGWAPPIVIKLKSVTG